MEAGGSDRWLNRFVWFIAAATLLLICSGGMVTSKGVGLAVPDWPTTFGYNMFLFPLSKWVGGVLFEHTHRLLASSVGLLTLILAEWMWIRQTHGGARWVGVVLMFLGTSILGVRQTPVQIGIGLAALTAFVFALIQAIRLRQMRWLGVAALGAVLAQGVLGGLRVELLKDEIGIFHACLAQAFLALLVLIGTIRSRFWQTLIKEEDTGRRARFFGMAVLTTILIYGQMALGATMRHQHKDLAILDFPTANASWWPDTSPQAIATINAWRDAHAFSDVTASQIWLQMAHRFGAVLVAVGLVATLVRLWRHDLPVLRRLGLFWILFLFLQVSLGASTIWSNKAADIATAHVAVGAVLLSLGVCLSVIGYRLGRSEAQPAAESCAVNEQAVFV